MIWIGLFLLLQEYYYLDGTEFILTNGTTIRTAEPVSVDALNYTWMEGSEFILIPKTMVKNVNYFTLRVPGRAPKKHYENIHQRRTTGKPAIYHKGDEEFLRFRHVNFKGRSIEGQVYYNIVRQIGVVRSGTELAVDVHLNQVRTGSVVELHFFSLEGKPLFIANIDVNEALTRKQRKKDRLAEWETRVPLSPDMNLDRVGLVEVVSFVKDDG